MICNTIPPPRPEIISFVVPIFVIFVAIVENLVHFLSDELFFGFTPLKYSLLII